MPVFSRMLPAVAAAITISACAPETPERLPSIGAVIGETSVSGISSGAYMAGQMQMAHASIIKGAAIIAGGPYGCAESVFSGVVIGPAAMMLNANKAVSGCMLNAMVLFGVPDPKGLAAKARERAAANEIDPVADVKTDKVYVFSGTNDRTVVPGIVASAVDFYRALGVPDQNIRFVSDLPAGHAFVTETEGGECERSAEPYIVDCDYDQAKDLLTHIYGPLQPPSQKPAGQTIVFDQSEFTRGDQAIGMAAKGVVYVPEACRAGGCRIHVAFHGCAQNRETVGDAFVEETGFKRWADTNRLIVLFPQTIASSVNPQGCWDWWGYSGREFLTRNAAQIRAVHAMVARLSGAG